MCVCVCVCEGGGAEPEARGVAKRRMHGGEIQVRNSEISTVQEASTGEWYISTTVQEE